MKPIAVVGSGPSGVHFAQTLLELGQSVVLVDVGKPRPPAVLPSASLRQLKSDLDDPLDYFLGSDFEGITFPGARGEYYGVPPGREYVFAEPGGFEVRARGFAPLFSFARGGLAEAWTGGVYPFNEAELADYPVAFDDMKAAYAEVARRIGICGELDDLARFMPPHDGIMPPLVLDRHSQLLMRRYGRVRERLNRELGCWLGRSRLATTTTDHGDRRGCRYLGRCLWGCPVDAIYTPSLTLAACLRHDRFRYLPDFYVTHFETGPRRRVTALVGRREDGSAQRIDVEAVALAAGALNTSRIFLESVYRATGELLRLGGLMDNQQVLVPFVNLDMLGVRYEPSSYQYHMLGLGLETPDPRHYVHGQITTLKTTMAHPIIQNLPFDARAATGAFRWLRGALGLVNVNFHDDRRDTNIMTLEPRPGREAALVIEYAAAPGEAANVDAALRRVRAALRRLHCLAPTAMAHVRPKGASVHYAGTLPMTREGGDCTATPDCRSRDFDNLFLVDGATFPFLPAKNITFTLMANAVRAARANFGP